MLILGVSPVLWVLLPVVAAQYALALFCLTKLAYLKLSTRAYVVWNVTILLVFFIGSAVFLIYYFKNRARLVIKPEAPEKAASLSHQNNATDENNSQSEMIHKEDTHQE